MIEPRRTSTCVVRSTLWAALGVLLVGGAGSTAVSAQTLEQALSFTYTNNPTLNAQRAALRAVDEGVTRAAAGLRPRAFLSGSIGIANSRNSIAGAASPITDSSKPRSIAAEVDQPIFDGFRTQNSVRGANSQVFAQREALNNAEQTVLLDAATAYMNVLRDFAILDLQRSNLDLLAEQLRAARQRFEVGEVTRTDVAQSESRLAAARSSVALAEANLKNSRATFRRVVGVEPGTLHPGRPLDRLLPATLEGAINTGLADHPAILAALHNVDVALMQVKTAEGALLPTVTVAGTLSSSYEPSISTNRVDQFALTGRMTVPIYQGGGEYAAVRQAKETLGQRRIEADVSRDQVRAAVVSAWGVLLGAKAQIEAAQAQVTAAQIAFNGVSEEQKVGQRTTLDVLNAQQELLNARVSLITAQRDRVVASYSLLQALGWLSTKRLNLKVATYDATIHYEQVKDKWFGLRTPDGR